MARLDLYAFLLEVKARPGMFVGSPPSLTTLESMIHGYAVALRNHELAEFGLDFNRRFADYLYQRFDWSMSCGWAVAFADHTRDAEHALHLFFELLDDFRAVQPSDDSA